MRVWITLLSSCPQWEMSKSSFQPNELSGLPFYDPSQSQWHHQLFPGEVLQKMVTASKAGSARAPGLAWNFLCSYLRAVAAGPLQSERLRTHSALCSLTKSTAPPQESQQNLSACLSSSLTNSVQSVCSGDGGAAPALGFPSTPPCIPHIGCSM